MDEDTVLPFDLPAVARKKVNVAFDGGMLSSDAGVLLLRGGKGGWAPRRDWRRASLTWQKQREIRHGF